MKLVLLSDLHLLWDNPVARLDLFRDTQLNKMAYVMDWADKEKAVVLQAGDFFDVPRSWFLCEQWTRFFTDFGQRGDLEVAAVFGQHDTYMYSEGTRNATVLGELAAAGLVRILGFKPFEYFDDIDIYGASYGQPVPEVLHKKAFNVLVIHEMIVPAKAWPDQKHYYYAPKFLEDHPEYDLILCGDLHQRFQFRSRDRRRYIVNTGCMSRHEATRYNMDFQPGFAVFDMAKRELWWEMIPHEPADRVLSRRHLEETERQTNMLNEFVEAMEKIDLGEDEGMSFQDHMVAYAKELKLTAGQKKIISETMDEEVKW